MDTEALLSSLFDCDAPMTSGNVMDGNMGYRDPMGMDFAAIDALLAEYSPVEAMVDTNDFLRSKDACYKNLPSPVHCQVQETNTKSARVDDGSTASERSRKRAKTQHRSRKDEVSSLRAQADSLHEKLLALKYKSARLNSAKDTSGAVVPSQAQQIWRRLALYQLDRRRRAEAENASLREMVAIQVLEAKNLRRVLKRRTRIEMMEDMLGMKTTTRLLRSAPTEDSWRFEELKRDARAVYRTIDSLFATKGVDAMPCTGHTRNVNLVNSVCYEMRLKRILPFSIQDTATAVWHCFGQLGPGHLRNVGGSKLHFNSHANPVVATENELQGSFTVAVSGVQGLLGTHQRQVVQMYQNNSRVVFICRCATEPIPQSGTVGVTSWGSAYIILENTAESAEGFDATVMKLYLSFEQDNEAENPGTQCAILALDNLAFTLPGDVETAVLASSPAGSAELNQKV